MELIIAREIIREWNALNAFAQNRILLPLDDQDGSRSHCPNDMLIAFFCGASGEPIDRSRDIESEIERQLKEGRPAHVYFSGARVDLIGTDADRAEALERFKKKYAPATVDLYGDEKEFRAKFARNLDATITTHPHFKTDEPETLTAPAAAPASSCSRSTEAPLSACAQLILIEACDDFEAYIGRIKIGNMLKIQANGKQLVEQGDLAAVTKWDGAFGELLSGGYIRDAGCNGQLFQISAKGFEFLKSMGKSPVGYIAELGGM